MRTDDRRGSRSGWVAAGLALGLAAGPWLAATAQTRPDPPTLPNAGQQRALMLEELRALNATLTRVEKLLREAGD